MQKAAFYWPTHC